MRLVLRPFAGFGVLAATDRLSDIGGSGALVTGVALLELDRWGVAEGVRRACGCGSCRLLRGWPVHHASAWATPEWSAILVCI
jgi:hypothetical protein